MNYRDNDAGLHILEIEITKRCNLHCKHCYVGGNQKVDLDENIVRDIIKQANDMKINRLVLTGGEPLLIEKVFEYATYAKTLEIPDIYLLTNGTLINEDIAKKCKIFTGIQMSLDGVPNKTGSLRDDYFQQLEKSISLLIKNNITTTLYATINKDNLSMLEDMINYANIQQCKIAFNCLIPTNETLKDLIPSPSELKKAFEFIVNEATKNPKVQLSHHFRFLVDNNKMNDFLENIDDKSICGGCLAGIAASYITADGDFLSCPFIRISAGNIKQQQLLDIWENSEFLRTLRNRKAFKGKCGKCKFLNCCGGCRASSLYKYGEIDNSDDNCFLEDL